MNHHNPDGHRKTIDYHCHILPGVDDGPKAQDESIEMARLFAEAGYRDVYCTPHLIKGMYEVSNEEVLYERDKLQHKLENEGIGIKLLAGREYYLDEYLLDYISKPLRLEGTNCIMIEIPNNTSVDLVKETIFSVKRRGYTPLIAHPERCFLLETAQREPQSAGSWKRWFSRGIAVNNDNESGNELLRYLKQLCCQFQGNLGSINGQYGGRVKASARYFEKNALYTHAGTDAHSPDAVKDILGIG
ncbi:MAG: CpsB/CapC family capsule biosynthesis tyrosine phosphatase [Chlorobiaceae bacterium]